MTCTDVPLSLFRMRPPVHGRPLAFPCAAFPVLKSGTKIAALSRGLHQISAVPCIMVMSLHGLPRAPNRVQMLGKTSNISLLRRELGRLTGAWMGNSVSANGAGDSGCTLLKFAGWLRKELATPDAEKRKASSTAPGETTGLKGNEMRGTSSVLRRSGRCKWA